MRTLDFLLALLLMATLLGGLLRILRGPTRGDRMLAAQLFGTTGVAVLLLLAEAMAMASLRDVALVFSVLAVVNAIVFVRSDDATSRGSSAGVTPRGGAEP